MNTISGFIAFPGEPVWIDGPIQDAVNRLNQSLGPDAFQSWKENDIAGRFIIDPIIEHIENKSILVADITKLNFNVTYEIGYAIGFGKRVVLVKNGSLESDSEEAKAVGIFDTLGWKTYEDGGDLFDIIAKLPDIAALPINRKIDRGAPVWVLQYPFKMESQGRCISRVKKARLKYRSFDPAEIVRLSANEAISNIASSIGVILQLAPAQFHDSKIHNIRAAFCAGLAHGMRKEALILQPGDDPVPLDYRDFVSSFKHPAQIDDYVAELATVVTEKLQQDEPLIETKRGVLIDLDLGSSMAENEFSHLGNYYVQTDEFRRTLRGEARLVVGRKGAGKTAVFGQVRDKVRSNKSNVVIDLKPEGYQLKKFKDQVLSLMEQGTAEHTITAFWEHLLLQEIAYKLLEKDRSVHLRDHRLLDPYQKLSAAYSGSEFEKEGDFSERMRLAVDKIIEAFLEKFDADSRKRLNQAQLTELLFLGGIRELRDAVSQYLSFKGEVWLLFDNLDKGWSVHGVSETDLMMLRALLDATRKMERDLKAKGNKCTTIVFLRNDILKLLVENTPDRGKESKASLDWSDGDLLRQLLKRRLNYNGLKGDDFFQLWRQICEPLVHGEESSQYLIERSLMRPRFLLNLLGYCKGFAVNLDHKKITEEDVKKGVSAFSTDLVSELDLEISDVAPFASKVIYSFIDLPAQISKAKFAEIAASHGLDNTQEKHLFELLLWHGVLGIVGTNGEARYIYDLNYDVQRLEVLVGRLTAGSASIAINPAFWAGLEIRIGLV